MDTTSSPTNTTSPGLDRTLRDMWETRPPRIPSDQGGNAKIAGVCEGIGVRFRIDPTLIRIAFVVAALTGSGILLYAICWLSMPRWSMPVSPLGAAVQKKTTRGLSGERTTGYLLIFALLVFSGILGFSDVFSKSLFVTLLLAGVLWWLLHSRTPEPPVGLIADPAAVPSRESTAGESTTGEERRISPNPSLAHLKPVNGYTVPGAETTPPSWDPLGTAPALWDLPEPGPAREPAASTPRAPWATALGTLALVTGALGGIGLIALAVISAFSPLSVPFWLWASTSALLVGGLGTGVGILNRGKIRAPALFIGIGASAALIFAGAVADDSVTEISIGAGDTTSGPSVLAPVSGDDLPARVDNGIGKTELDLRGLRPLTESREVNVSNGVGKTVVWLPTDVPVTVNCSNGVGRLVCTPGDYNTGAEGERLTLDITNGVGKVVVHAG
ncbi:PspC domain-containing protein [Corynebacterium pygosceleis]|uniref:PspC domain-containing protein n=1 Tax=Corynebacterium pygosceleis TaxID=2800406 RepID=A0A9Q4C9R3_9CORY|nr:PspC domain-containing protein [Corynebacterium pygosceleis]MCK7637596.1 PspC domain-containing protein [Corynebacterium pygosceleis]MCK7674787.1 PspC domain-containing protein [Corynebacterium pygosceleis]MCL0119624.1 PspC domain-containing protein [Corynebacterium pygosceleis]MCX7444865.1 PspC domain-containing protein [Corynebacterium pygosceleis]MCX7468075.1 PspC domain-containing protein [Corynebacterium pygosceleis]